MDKTDILKPFMDVGRGPLIIDGGLATELESTGCKLQVKYIKFAFYE